MVEVEIVEIDGEEIKCEVIDLMEEYGEALKSAPSYKKIAIVVARQAKIRELVCTSQDGMQNYASPGDWVIQNPGEDAYVFGNKDDSLEIRQKKFAERYKEISPGSGKFQSQGIIKALNIDRNIVFLTSWGERMAVEIGGFIADGGYSISEKSFANTYKKI